MRVLGYLSVMSCNPVSAIFDHQARVLSQPDDLRFTLDRREEIG
jgi:hypothetical protein